jgi:hypothetical protein
VALPAQQFDAAPRRTGAHCLRNPWRVAILGTLGDPIYFFWWMYQFFQFTRRQGFPRARAFWWIFVPFFGLYILWVQLDDLRRAAATTNSEQVNPSLVLGLIVGASAAGQVLARSSETSVLLVMLVVGSSLMGAALYSAQSAVSSYLAVRYPFEPPRGMTVGEYCASAVGIILQALLLIGIFLPS